MRRIGRRYLVAIFLFLHRDYCLPYKFIFGSNNHAFIFKMYDGTGNGGTMLYALIWDNKHGGWYTWGCESDI